MLISKTYALTIQQVTELQPTTPLNSNYNYDQMTFKLIKRDCVNEGFLGQYFIPYIYKLMTTDTIKMNVNDLNWYYADTSRHDSMSRHFKTWLHERTLQDMTPWADTSRHDSMSGHFKTWLHERTLQDMTAWADTSRHDSMSGHFRTWLHDWHDDKQIFLKTRPLQRQSYTWQQACLLRLWYCFIIIIRFQL